MLRDITLGQYYPADSVIHKLDPRVKLFATMLYIISLFCFISNTSCRIFNPFTYFRYKTRVIIF